MTRISSGCSLAIERGESVTIEREYRRLIGARQFAELAKLLDALNASTAA